MLFKLIGFCALVAVCSAERVIMDFFFILKILIKKIFHFINKAVRFSAIEIMINLRKEFYHHPVSGEYLNV